MRTISYKVSYEKLISRLPALFAYLDIDQQGTCEIVKATNSVHGDYGKIVANIEVPYNFEYVCSDGTELKIIGQKVYSYRTLIDTYYKAISDTDWERNNDNEKFYKEPFLAFIERGIGLKYVGLSKVNTNETECGVNIVKEYPLAPDYIYLSEAKVLLDRMVKMRKQLSFFKEHIEMYKDDIKYYNQLKEEYELSNGDSLIDVLEKLVTKAKGVAKEYLNYAREGLSLGFNVNLVNTIKDLGMVTPYIQEWVPGKRYYNGDVAYYEDENGYGMTWECILPKGIKYTEGSYDDETEIISFDKENWKPQSLNWINRYEKLYNDNIKEKGSITVSGECNSHLSSLRRFETYTNRNGEAEYPDKYKDWLWYYRVKRILNREEKYDELGNIGVMYDEKDKDENVIRYGKGVEAITNTKDGIGGNLVFDDNNEYVVNLAAWGDAITKITAENNIEDSTGILIFEYIIGTHLKAKKDADDNGIWYSVDDDGNYKYFFKEYAVDTDSKYGKNMGVKYTETYIYYKGNTDMEIGEAFGEYKVGEIISEEIYKSLTDEDKKKCHRIEESIWTLVEDVKFNDYINGTYDKDSINSEKYNLYDKMEFEYDTHKYNLRVGHAIKEVPYVLSKFETNVDITHVDIEERPLIRYDYYNGVNFQPSIDEGVNIERGVTQAFDKHIRLGEIKTFEDFENYSNGGFFVISKENIDLG